MHNPCMMMLFSCHAFHRRFLAGQATHFDCVHMAAFSPRRALRLAMLIAMTLVVLGQGTVSDSQIRLPRLPRF